MNNKKGGSYNKEDIDDLYHRTAPSQAEIAKAKEELARQTKSVLPLLDKSETVKPPSFEQIKSRLDPARDLLEQWDELQPAERLGLLIYLQLDSVHEDNNSLLYSGDWGKLFIISAEQTIFLIERTGENEFALAEFSLPKATDSDCQPLQYRVGGKVTNDLTGWDHEKRERGALTFDFGGESLEIKSISDVKTWKKISDINFN